MLGDSYYFHLLSTYTASTDNSVSKLPHCAPAPGKTLPTGSASNKEHGLQTGTVMNKKGNKNKKEYPVLWGKML